MADTPFPERELLVLAEHCENIGRAWSERTAVNQRLRKEHLDRAAACRNAVRAFDAMRERALLAEQRAAAYEYGAPNGISD